MPSDEELFDEYRRTGSQDLFAEIVRRYERPLYVHLVQILGQRELAEDAFQRTFLKVHLRRSTYESGRPLRPWIYRIARNQAIDLMRREHRHNATSIDAVISNSEGQKRTMLRDSLADEHPSPAHDADVREEQAQAHTLLAALPEPLQAVVQLVYFQGMKYRDAARVLAIPTGTVKSRMHTAKQLMRSRWEACPVPVVNGA